MSDATEQSKKASAGQNVRGIGEWQCPYCQHKNIDSTNLTAVPMCGGCGVDVHWNVIERSGNWKSLQEAAQ